MTVIHVLGDSLVTAYGSDENNFIGGWGDHLGNFFESDKVKVYVYAEGGRSSRSFLNEGRFVETGRFTKDSFPFGMGPACSRIKKGDYVLMEFCHNDDNSKGRATYLDRMTPPGEPDECGRYPTVVPSEDMKVPTDRFPEEYPAVLYESGMTEAEVMENRKKYEQILPTYGEKYYSYSCGATYKGYLKFYIDKIREKGAYPVIVTAPARQYYENEKIVSVKGHHGGSDRFGDFTYIRAIRQLAEEEQVIKLELFEYSVKLYETLGSSKAKYLQSIIGLDGKTLGESRYGRPAKWVEDYDRYWENGEFLRYDCTHMNRFGSFLYSGYVAAELVKAVPELNGAYIRNSNKKVAVPKRLQGQLPAEFIR